MCIVECACHQWFDTEVIGDWTQGSGGGPSNARPVRQIVATESIWERSSHEELTAGIRANGGITCEYALLATTYLDGHIGLNNGLHRWAVAIEEGVRRIPVEMQYEPEPTLLPDFFASWV